ncbi:MAG: hypothetical protein IGQ45_07835 [Cyanobacterium sp. T60_A2020_053]|nr:hypothetical protein [Cyanobacterium sp. T60_A2020_053]
MFAEEIRQKAKNILCDFYESNETLIKQLSNGYGRQVNDIQYENVHGETKNGLILNSSLIIGILCSFDQEMSSIIELFCSATDNDVDKIINVLDLNYDYQYLIDQRNKERQEKAEQEAKLIPPSPLDEFRQKIIENP